MIQDKAADFASIVFRPHHKYIGNRAVGNPHFGAGNRITARHSFGAGLHACRVGARIRLGKAEAAHPLASGQLGQVFVFLRVGAVSPNRVHHQARLHAHGRTVAGIHPLHRPRNHAVGHMRHTGTAVAVDGGAQQAQFTHFTHDVAVEQFFAVGLNNAGHQGILAKRFGGFGHHALFFGELLLQQQRVVPVKRGAAVVFGHGVSPQK